MTTCGWVSSREPRQGLVENRRVRKMSKALNSAKHGAANECASCQAPRITANPLPELGIYVIALALFYGSLGIILFFDRGLLAFSNVRCLW